ncbi:ABC transporter substrate-binding protein [Frankia sp. CcI49]|uniref:ABC transporter substrate-binding protein n=1 Tax=Frankia sp. CcI49 TaxID=1745382 RepID=UPI000E2FC30F|nr:ABC transporter substrate-binding protein [Frankia sp. CcI49]
MNANPGRRQRRAAHRYLRRVAAALCAVALPALAACADSGAGASQAGSTAGLTIGSVDLSKVCPAKVVIQTDWNPQAEQGGLYQLLGPNPVLDDARKQVRGPLYAKGEWTGVEVEIRSGGPAIGNQSVAVEMYTDPDILLGWVNTDEAVQNSAEHPVTQVFATFDKAPWMIMWDPGTYPGVSTIKELGKAGATVRYFDGATWMDYLIGNSILRRDQVDGSYDGSPATFLAAGGKAAQQGFATVEPYLYRNELPQWHKPVAYQLISDTGYPLYAVALSVRSRDVTAQSACLSALIPVVQQSTVDYFAHPEPANRLIIKAVDAFDNGWVYTAGQAADSAKSQLTTGVVSNGGNGTLGDFDGNRIQTILDITTPILTRNGTAPADGLKATGLFTNRFLDPGIGLGTTGAADSPED